MSLTSPLANWLQHHPGKPVRITLLNGSMLSDVGTMYRYRIQRISQQLWVLEAVTRKSGTVMGTSILRDDQVALVETFPDNIFEEETDAAE